MTNEYEWIDISDHPRREFGARDVTFGWIVYAAAVLYLVF